MTIQGKASTIVDHWPGDEPGDRLAGWYIISLDADGTCYDAIGPYDSEAEAIRIMEENVIA
jgi:hypothetical protein